MAPALRVVLLLLAFFAMLVPLAAAETDDDFLQSHRHLRAFSLAASQAEVAAQAGKYRKSIRLGKRALSMANALALPDLVWRVQVLLGDTYMKTGQLENAEQAFRSAQAAVDLVNGSLANDRAKRQFGVDKADITAHLIDFGLAENNALAVFEDAERGRARAFVDLLAETELAFSDDLVTNRQVRALDQNIRDLRLQHSYQTSTQRSRTLTEIQSLMGQRNALMDKLAAINTEWAAAYTVRYATLAQVQAKLAASEMLVYSVSGKQTDDIHLMFVLPTHTEFKHIPGGHVAVNKALISLTDGIALADQALQTQALEQISIVLDLKTWPKADQLYMVPNRQLHFVPWAALDLGQWVSVLPNGSWLLRTGKKASAGKGQLIVGDPDFAGQLPQLPGSRDEASRVAKLYRVDPLLGAKASAANVVQNAQKKLQVLHLATHGVFDYVNPLQSALYFSAGANAVGAEKMTAEDVFRKPVRADLVVLSACETGVGQVLADNDILGLLRSFYMNGASQAVNTLWPVSDQGTQEFMSVFHANLSQGTGVALNQAVQASKAAGHPPSVYAAFVLNGYTQHAVAP